MVKGEGNLQVEFAQDFNFVLEITSKVVLRSKAEIIDLQITLTLILRSCSTLIWKRNFPLLPFPVSKTQVLI